MRISPKVKAWLVDVAERVGSSFGEAVLAAVTAGALAHGVNASTAHVLLVAGLTAAAATLKGILAAALKGSMSPASLAPASQPAGPAALAQVGHVAVGLVSEIARSGARLGRHVEHDVRSLAYPVDAAGVITSKQWRRHGGVFDQGDVGSCTGQAMAGLLNTEPFRAPRRRLLTEKDAVKLYSLATQLDAIPGVYPPTDTGSSGLAAAKAAQRLGYIDGYRHAFGLRAALAGLMAGPEIFGTVWLTGMDSPDARGIVSATGVERGGHEYEALGVDAVQKLVWFENSWGRTYGVDGRFALSWDDVDRLLRQHGDVVQPTLPATTVR